MVDILGSNMYNIFCDINSVFRISCYKITIRNFFLKELAYCLRYTRCRNLFLTSQIELNFGDFRFDPQR